MDIFRIDQGPGSVVWNCKCTDNTFEIFSASQRNIERYTCNPKQVPDTCQQRREINVFCIEFVNYNHPANTSRPRFLKDSTCIDFDTGTRVNHNAGGINTAQRADYLSNQIGIAWCVKYIKFLPTMHKGR